MIKLRELWRLYDNYPPGRVKLALVDKSTYGSIRVELELKDVRGEKLERLIWRTPIGNLWVKRIWHVPSGETYIQVEITDRQLRKLYDRYKTVITYRDFSEMKWIQELVK